jgi:hypothetical protein
MDFLFPLSLMRLLPDLTISMSNMACVLKEAGTDYPSQEPGFTPGFWWGLCCSPFYFLCCVVHLCFVDRVDHDDDHRSFVAMTST